jgi:hypothetical protein
VPAPASPLDSTYFQNVGDYATQTANKVAGLGQQQALAGTNLQNTLDQYGRQLPLDQLAAEIAANRRGALFSTSLGNIALSPGGAGQQGSALGELGYRYLQNTRAAQTAYDRLAASIADQITGLGDAQQLYNDQQYQAAADRAALLAAKNPALGQPTTRLRTPPPGAPSSARWSGARRPAGNWRGIGGGWWVPQRGR